LTNLITPRPDGNIREGEGKMYNMDVKIKEHGYQRNGVGGKGFYYFKISFKDDNLKRREAFATLTVNCDEISDHPEKFNGSCRVITTEDLSEHWRGDVFESEIRKQYKLWHGGL
jgi:hypothetical protein